MIVRYIYNCILSSPDCDLEFATIAYVSGEGIPDLDASETSGLDQTCIGDCVESELRLPDARRRCDTTKH